MKGNWVTIRDGEYGEGETKRVNLASLTEIWKGRREISTGIFRTAIYLMPRAKRVIVESDSLWLNRLTHCCYGTSYMFADPETIAKLADDTGDERLMALVPELVDA
jgi:hypothetical protein